MRLQERINEALSRIFREFDGESMPAGLREAANVGEWLEARLHLRFTELADEMFGGGYLTREERIALSSAIGSALDAFRERLEADMPGLYSRAPWMEADADSEMTESGEFGGEYVDLFERAVRADGTIPLKVIEPGWGSSGYYPAEVLERDGPALFRAGTQMFWNHQTMSEEAERPEGSLHDLAAVLVSDSRYEADGIAGPGLYADARVFEGFRGAVDELAPYIGVSIRARGTAATGEAEGRRGRIVQSIDEVRSVDFVTKPGAGGRILEMFEAARPGWHQSLQEAEQRQEIDMSEQELNELRESVNAMQARQTELESRLQESATENARLREALLLRDAADVVRTALAESGLPDLTQNRLLAALTANPPVQAEGGGLDVAALRQRVQEAAQAEAEYLASVTGSGAIRGFGDAQRGAGLRREDVRQTMVESFKRLGFSENAATIAANGRV